MKEKTLLSYNADGIRLQLVQKTILTYRKDQDQDFIIVYQVRSNRCVLDTTHSEYKARRLFVQKVQSDALQLNLI